MRSDLFSARRWPGLLCLLACLPLGGVPGCAPRVIVRQNPSANDTGIRYYRPKPYLLIAALDKDTAASPDYVSITLDYLPDFSEEYSIDVRPGLGIADVGVTLEDGWNLVAINQKLDSQTDEKIEASAELLKAAAGLATPHVGVAPSARTGIEVQAHNVPLGYYEAVLGRNRQGKKQLYGFRYVGFMPFQACPLEMCGSAAVPCDEGMLYGLTFDSGVMTFKPLCEIAAVLPPTQQVPLQTAPEVPLIRNFSRTWTVKPDGGKEEKVTIQDTGSLPIAVPFSEVNQP